MILFQGGDIIFSPPADFRPAEIFRGTGPLLPLTFANARCQHALLLMAPPGGKGEKLPPVGGRPTIM